MTKVIHRFWKIVVMSHPITDDQRELLIKLGERVKSIRKEKNLTLEQVSSVCGKDRQSLHKLENGKFNPSYIYLIEICKGLDIEIWDLLGE